MVEDMERAFKWPLGTGSHLWLQRCARLLPVVDFLVAAGSDGPLYTKYPALTSSLQDGCSPGKQQDTQPESARYHTRTKRHDVNGDETSRAILRGRGFDVSVRAHHRIEFGKFLFRCMRAMREISVSVGLATCHNVIQNLS